MKKIVTILMVGICLFSFFVIMGTTKITANEYYGNVLESGSAGETIIYTLYDSDSDLVGDILVFSGTGAMDTYDMKDKRPSSWNSIRKVIIEYGVTQIGDFTFYKCANLESVSIPESVTDLGKCTFWECENLKEINIPLNITSIKNGLFYECKSLESVKLPNSLIEIGSNAFYNTGLRSVVFPDKLQKIGSSAFAYTDIKDIQITKNINEIGKMAFIGTLIEEYKVDANSIYYTTIEGVLFDKAGINLILYPVNNPKKTYRIPIGTVEIKNSAFYAAERVVEVSIPSTVENIENYAFYGCSNLKRVNIPKEITTIKLATFGNCASLEKIVIPDSVITIEDMAFEMCKSLKELVLPDNVESVSMFAFDNCTGLEKILILNESVWLSNEWLFTGRNTKIVGLVGSTAQKYVEEVEADYIFEVLDKHGLIMESDGNIRYYQYNEFKSNYTGIVDGYYVIEGIVGIECIGLYKIWDIWYYVLNGKIITDYTGLANNSNGIWYVEDGRITFSYTGKVTVGGMMYTVSGSKVTGTVDENTKGILEKVDGIWRYYINGVLDTTFTGMAENENGTWYVENGIITFNYTGYIKSEDKIYKVSGSKVLGEGQLQKLNGIWYFMVNGAIDIRYTGIADNGNGTWYVQNGRITFNYTDKVTIDGVTYTVSGSKVTGTVDENATGTLQKVNGTWGYYVNGMLDTTYTGLADNANGIWYVENGIITFKYNGKVTINGIAYTIVNSKVQ